MSTQQAEAAFDRFRDDEAESANIEEIKFFGFRALRLNGASFVILDGDALAFKLGEDALQAALALEGAKRWNPYGREKKKWIQVPAGQATAWDDCFDQAAQLARNS